MNKNKQSGFVMVLTLIIMVALSLVAIPAMRSANINMKIISNEGSRALLRNQVQRSIEQIVNDASGVTYSNPQAQTVVVDGQVVSIQRPVCVATKPASGYSVDDEIPPEDTVWELPASAVSPTGGRVTIVQGLKIRMLAGSCV